MLVTVSFTCARCSSILMARLRACSRRGAGVPTAQAPDVHWSMNDHGMDASVVKRASIRTKTFSHVRSSSSPSLAPRPTAFLDDYRAGDVPHR